MKNFNDRVAVRLTKLVGSMWMAYAFTLLALAGLPSALHPGGEGLVAWVAQTFLQLVLLSVIMVGQDVQAQATEARDRETHDTVMTELRLFKAQHKELAEDHKALKEVLKLLVTEKVVAEDGAKVAQQKGTAKRSEVR